jgi:hypothetical protein
VNRAARKAETRAEEKAGTLILAGEGLGAPKKQRKKALPTPSL